MPKIHLHDEQFDGWLHAACGAMSQKPDPLLPHIVTDEAFEAAAECLRCRNCAKLHWPHGGEPS